MRGLLEIGLLLAGLGLSALVVASFWIPKVLGFREKLVGLTPLMRELFWTYAVYVFASHVFFGVLALGFGDWLLGGSGAAALVSGFVCLWWGVRLWLQFFGFDLAEVQNTRFHRLCKHGLTLLFVFLTGLFGLVCWWNLWGGGLGVGCFVGGGRGDGGEVEVAVMGGVVGDFGFGGGGSFGVGGSGSDWADGRDLCGVVGGDEGVGLCGVERQVGDGALSVVFVLLVRDGSREFRQEEGGVGVEERCVDWRWIDGGGHGIGLVGLVDGVETDFGDVCADEFGVSLWGVESVEGGFAVAGFCGANFVSKFVEISGSG